MDITVILGVLTFLALVVLIVILLRKKDPEQKDNSQAFLLIQHQLNEITRTMDAKLSESAKMFQTQFSESTKAMQSQFGESAKIIREITQELTKVGEGQKQVVDIAKQLENLRDILKNPKQRGVLGEYYLKSVLENVIPPGSFEMQYKFKDGTIVDAVIKVKERIIPVDSKFSLENYTRLLEAKDPTERTRLEGVFRDDLKARVDETSKYIKPDEGTMDFAFMFIPSEAVYYDLLINKVGSVKTNMRDLIQYASGEKKVMIVSPTTFHAYLQTVLQGLKALQIEESAKEIRKRVAELGRHLGSYETYMQKLGMHLGTSVGMYNKAYKELGKIDKDVLRIGGTAAGIEVQEIAGPVERDEQDQERML